MLLRKEEWDVLHQDVTNILTINVKRALYVRMYLRPVPVSGVEPKHQTASCHILAHAFARVFDLPVVDGERAYLVSTTVKKRRFGRGIYCDYQASSYLHSWIELKLPNQRRIILDLFPDRNDSMLPIVVRAPHPAYWVPPDSIAQENLREAVESQLDAIRLFEGAIREIAVQFNLFSKGGA